MRGLAAGSSPGRRDAFGESGQMTVEMAVLMPVTIVVALVAYNLVRFVGACALFDRAAADCVIAHGVSPSEGGGDGPDVESVRAALEGALPSESCEVSVEAEGSGSTASPSGAVTFPLSPSLTTFTCTLRYRPWPSSFVLAGVGFSPPLALVHERSVVVDCHRPGVVV
jgi:hypothetical protein